MAKDKTAVIQITRKGAVIWIGLITFIAAWMFVLGILVGRGTAPVNLDAYKLEKELTALKAAMLEKEQAEIEAKTKGQGAELTDLGFYEALKSNQSETRFKIKSKPAPKPLPVAVEPPKKSAVEPEPKKTITTKPAPEPKPKSQSTSTPKPEAKPPQPSKSPNGKGRFTIQVAALKDSQSANQLVNILRGKGYQAYHIRSQVSSKGIIYRVRVGAFRNRKAANDMLTRLKKDKYQGIVIATP